MSAPVFVVGAPRSGTTFLQNLLGAHPRVATSQETDLFTHYVRLWRETWARQLPTDPEEWRRWRHKGLPAVFTEDEFDEVLGAFVERVHARTLALKPGADVVVDKTPAHGRHGESILRYLPAARFVHLVRDGRDATASLLRASRGWGSGWAPGTAAAAARQWRDDVDACRALGELTPAYHEVRYERLASEQGRSVLREVFAFAGIELDADECAELLDHFDLERGSPDASSLVWGGEVMRRLTAPPLEPTGFGGSGGVGAWRRDLDLRARLEVEREAGGQLRALGYVDSADWVGSSAPRRASAAATLAYDALTARLRWHVAHWIRG